MLDGLTLSIDSDAVVVVAGGALDVVSSAPVGGGVRRARALLNLHVAADFGAHDLDAHVDAFARARGIQGPWIGFLTAARTERAETATAQCDDVRACAVVTVGLTHPVAAGVIADAAEPAPVGTINAIVIVDAAMETAALVNAVALVGEIKAAVVLAAGVRCADGRPASGTATDAIAVAATATGPRHRFAGPASVAGRAIARAARAALERGVDRWLEAHR